MKPHFFFLTTALMGTTAILLSACEQKEGAAPNPQEKDAPDMAADTSAVTEVAALHREWILVGWEKKEGDEPLNFQRKLGKYYDRNSTDVILYDDFDPKRRTARSAAEYGSFWEPPFTALRSAQHWVVEGPHVVVSGHLAVSNLVFGAKLTGGDGKVTGIKTVTSLVWRNKGNGWKIFREHNSSTVLTTAELDESMKQFNGR